MPKFGKVIALTGAFALLAGVVGCSSPSSDEEHNVLVMSVDNGLTALNSAEALAAAFEAKNPDVTIRIEPRPGGAEGDPIVKTRLNTGDLGDILMYNSGALLQQLNAAQNLVPLDNEAWIADTSDAWQRATTVDGSVYGAPVGGGSGGGILYNRAVFDDLGLDIPQTWDELIEVSQTIKKAGIIPVLQTYKDSFTAQFLVLADYYNLEAAEPDFADQWTAGEVKFSETPAAMAGFEHLAELHELGLTNEDYITATYDQGQQLLASGEAAMYPNTTGTVRAMLERYPDAINDIGLFPIPGDSADSNGLTLWQPLALYITKSSENQDVARKFLAFVASPEGWDTWVGANGATGISPLSTAVLPDSATQAVKDILPFLEAGNVSPALEFVSPVKGAALPDITVAVGSGLTSPADAAAQYDADSAKVAQQLGLPGW